MGEQGAGPGGGQLTEAQKKFLFATCFIALVATSFAFVMRAFLGADWQIQFGLSETQKGELWGAGLWPFGLSIVLFSLFIDRVGYGKSMIFAFVCHVVSVFLFFFAQGYWSLYFGSLLCGLAAGTVEAVINPAIASVYPKQKTKWLTLLHAGWPGGIVLNGIFLLMLGEQGLQAPWQLLVFLLLIPVVIYGIMLLKAKFPVSERVVAKVPYKDMLSEAGAVGWFIVIFMVGSELSRLFGLEPVLTSKWFFDVPSWPFIALIVVTTGFYFWYTRSLGRWMYVFLLFVMILLAITELGTDNWIKDLMGPAMAKIKLSGGWLLVYSAGIMMVLRLAIGPVQNALSKVSKVLATPLGILLLSAVLAAVGIFCLSWAEGGWILLFATIYGMGQCFFWPMTLGLVGERFPRGGALTLNAVAGVGMLGVGILGNQFWGFWQDRGIDKSLQERDKAAYVRLIDPEERASIFGSYKSLDGRKVNDVTYKTNIYDHRKKAAEAATPAPSAEDLTKKLLAEDGKYKTLVRVAFDNLAREKDDTKDYSPEEMHEGLEREGIVVGDREYDKASADKKLVDEVRGQAKKDAMAGFALLPAIMAFCYIGLIIYFKKRGGYKAIDIGAEG
ncbi:MAG: MFS transporter [Planctomycetota bacterium]|jgi:MFS family permease